MKRALAAVALIAIAGTCEAKPGPSAQNGHAVFDKWCAPCHAPVAKLAGTLALQTKYKGALPAALEQRTDLTPDVVGYFVRNGVAWMAPFRKTEVSDAELADLGAYLSKAPAPKKAKTK